MKHLLFRTARDTVVATLIGNVVTVLVVFMWWPAAKDLPVAFWNPLSYHVQHELNVPPGSYDAEVLMREVDRWLEERGQTCVTELRERDERSWLALACERPADLTGLRDVAIGRSGLLDNSVVIGISPTDLFERFVTHGVPAQLQPLLSLLFLANAVGFLAVGWWRLARTPIDEIPVDWLQPRGSTTTRVVWGACGGVALLTISGAVQWVLTASGISQAEQSAVLAAVDLRGIAYLVFVAAVVGLAPIGEELFFRGVVFRSFAATGRVAWGYALSTVLFAVLHLHPPLVVTYLISGLALAWLYDRTRWLGTPIIAHSVVNGLGVWLLRG